MKPTIAQYAPYVLCAILLATQPARADTVILHGKQPFRNVEVCGFEDGKLEFRGVSRETLRKPLEQVARIQLTAKPMLSNAEHLLTRDAAAACTAYELVLADCDQAWLSDFVRGRLVGTYDKTGRFSDAVEAYVGVVRRHPRLAEPLAPANVAPRGSNANLLSIKSLRSFWHDSAAADRPEAVRRLYLELLIIEDVSPVPADLCPAETDAEPVTGDVPPAQTEDLPPLLFGDSGPHDQDRPRDRSATQPSRKAPVLAGDSIALKTARKLLAQGKYAAAGRIIERLRPYLDPEAGRAATILLARCRIEAGEPAAAADDLLKLAESADSRSLAAEALYYVAFAHERLDRVDVALDIYSQLLDREDLRAEVRENVRRRLENLER